MIYPPSDPDMIVLGEVVGCHYCLAYIDGLVHPPQDGFCPQCGTHMKTRKEEQTLKDKREQLLREMGVLKDA